MEIKTSRVPMITADGERINTTWKYSDDGQICAMHSIETDDHRMIVRSGETFVIQYTDREVKIVPEPPMGPRGNVAHGWPSLGSN